MKRATLIALAAAVLSAKMAGAVGYSGEEIDRLEDLIDRQDIAAIQEFASDRSDLSAEDPLGALLLSISDRDNVTVDGVEVAWNVRFSPRRHRARNRGWDLALHWRPSHKVMRGLYGKPGRKPPHIY